MGVSRGFHGDRGAERARGETVAESTTPAATAYAAYGDALRTHLAAYTRDHAAGEDLLHETFVRLLTELAAGRQPRHLRAWLFRVGINLATSRARHHGVRGAGHPSWCAGRSCRRPRMSSSTGSQRVPWRDA